MILSWFPTTKQCGKGDIPPSCKKRNVRSASQMKIKNKTPIKLGLAYISKKSIPSEAFQPEDRPAELTVKEGNRLDVFKL